MLEIKKGKMFYNIWSYFWFSFLWSSDTFLSSSLASSREALASPSFKSSHVSSIMSKCSILGKPMISLAKFLYFSICWKTIKQEIERKYILRGFVDPHFRLSRCQFFKRQVYGLLGKFFYQNYKIQSVLMLIKLPYLYWQFLSQIASICECMPQTVLDQTEFLNWAVSCEKGLQQSYATSKASNEPVYLCSLANYTKTSL